MHWIGPCTMKLQCVFDIRKGMTSRGQTVFKQVKVCATCNLRGVKVLPLEGIDWKESLKGCVIVANQAVHSA